MSLLTLVHLTKQFGGLAAVNDCNLTIEAGEIHALIGPNGAGKTTLINQISGALRPTRGQILFDGHNITHLPQHQRVRLGLARTFQIINLFKSYTILENLELAVQARNGSSFRFWNPVRYEAHLREEAEQISELLGLTSRNHTVVAELSHGEQRQLEVGLALACKPKMLLLDEPMAGMGPEESEQMVELISNLRRSLSTASGNSAPKNPTLTILLVEHDMDAVFRLASRISVLVYGHVIASGLPEAIRANPDVHKAYLGDEGGRQR
ncbi:ABC transporter ATP-binding protein [Meiothermus sp.]|uniref:ABC transporter ATP-binding protein n=1 Tax=Meiothermus sp. TaxID=1955249 RepID=UPI00307D5529